MPPDNMTLQRAARGFLIREDKRYSDPAAYGTQWAFSTIEEVTEWLIQRFGSPTPAAGAADAAA
jgi:hypothetical protein